MQNVNCRHLNSETIRSINNKIIKSINNLASEDKNQMKMKNKITRKNLIDCYKDKQNSNITLTKVLMKIGASLK